MFLFRKQKARIAVNLFVLTIVTKNRKNISDCQKESRKLSLKNKNGKDVSFKSHNRLKVSYLNFKIKFNHY